MCAVAVQPAGARRRAARRVASCAACGLLLATGACGPDRRARGPEGVPTRSLVTEIGRSRGGQPLLLEVFDGGGETVLIFGGIHGNEAGSAALVHRLVAHLRAEPAAWRGRTVAVVAEANPDGLLRGTRGNAAGVDLNRNFPAQNWRPPRGSRGGGPGATAGSEPETQALLMLLTQLRPARVLAVHVITRGRECNNYDGPAEALARALGRHNGYPVRAAIGYPTPGSFGSWAGVDQGIPVITLELPAGVGVDALWEANREALLTFIAGGS